MHSAVAIGVTAHGLALSYLLSQRQILCRYVHAIDINNTPYVVLQFSYIGGLLSVVRFYWFGSTAVRSLFHIHFSGVMRISPPYSAYPEC